MGLAEIRVAVSAQQSSWLKITAAGQEEQGFLDSEEKLWDGTDVGAGRWDGRWR